MEISRNSFFTPMPKIYLFSFIFSCCFMLSCRHKASPTSHLPKVSESSFSLIPACPSLEEPTLTVPTPEPSIPPIDIPLCIPDSDHTSLPDSMPTDPQLAQRLTEIGLQDVQELDASIQVRLKYASTDNFMDVNVYGKLNQCFLQKEVAEMLAQAQVFLKEKHANLSLIVFDGVRPRSVQKQMWEIVKGTPMQPYVAPPWPGSMHNHGAAVDVGLVDSTGCLLDMGTSFDHLGPLAQPRYEQQFLKEGKLTIEQLQNRWLLRKVMKQAGFRVILSEWWHFNAFSKEATRAKYEVVE